MTFLNVVSGVVLNVRQIKVMKNKKKSYCNTYRCFEDKKITFSLDTFVFYFKNEATFT
jgi:hypothetical protein